ncbi:hypothetical protein [Baekduia sp. Peel2402]|uniref:hypothetical protein n=1 Tax=Baekduia sp. Peel2402 TaxID=3458296 RepID=UPI00403EAE1C
MLLGLLITYLTGLVACGLALLHQVWAGPKAVHIAVDVGVLAVVAVGYAVHENPAREGSFTRQALEDPLLAHTGAVLVAFAAVPWIGAVGLMGADLALRSAFYEQIVQVIPVLLLAVILERQFFDVRSQAAPRNQRADRFILRAGFFVLVVGPAVAELFGLAAIATSTGWIEAMSTLLAGMTIPALLTLILTPPLAALYALDVPNSGEPAA